MQRTAGIIVAEENLEHGDHFKIPRCKPAVATRKGRNVFGSRDSEAVLLQSGVHCVTAGKQLVRCDAKSADTCGAAQGVGDE